MRWNPWYLFSASLCFHIYNSMILSGSRFIEPTTIDDVVLSCACSCFACVNSINQRTMLCSFDIPWIRLYGKIFASLALCVGGTHRRPVDSPHKGQWRGALMFPLTCASANSWANNRDDGDLRRHRALYEVTVMYCRLKCELMQRLRGRQEQDIEIHNTYSAITEGMQKYLM